MWYTRVSPNKQRKRFLSLSFSSGTGKIKYKKSVQSLRQSLGYLSGAQLICRVYCSWLGLGSVFKHPPFGTTLCTWSLQSQGWKAPQLTTSSLIYFCSQPSQRHSCLPLVTTPASGRLSPFKLAPPRQSKSCRCVWSVLAGPRWACHLPI